LRRRYAERVTHEYVIATGGIVLPRRGGTDQPATALAWAADRVLAVGSDAMVRAISRGDSMFLDLRGCAVTTAPLDQSRAEALARALVAAGHGDALVERLADVGLIDDPGPPDVGASAELAFWNADPSRLDPSEAASLRMLAIVHGGAFTEGDEHRGPFLAADS